MDKLLRETAKCEIQRREGHCTGDLKLSHTVKMRTGDEYSDVAITVGYKPGQFGSNLIGIVDALDSVELHVGHSYGGRSVMDN